jgi:hypothetical protein
MAEEAKKFVTNTKVITKFSHCKTIRDLKNSDSWKDMEKEHQGTPELLMNIIKYCFNDIDDMHQWAVEWTKV